MLLKSDLGVQQTHLRGLLEEQKLMLSCSFRCGRVCSNHCYDFWSDFVMLLRSDLGVQQIHLRGWFVEQILMLSLIFRCDQIYKYEIYDLDTLCCATKVRLWCLTNPPHISLRVTKFIATIAMNLITPFCGAKLQLRCSTNSPLEAWGGFVEHLSCTVQRSVTKIMPTTFVTF